MIRNIYVGWDPREEDAYDVACDSFRRQSKSNIEITALRIDDLYEKRLMWRPVERHHGCMIDHLSGAPQSTEFATSRFVIPFIQRSGWALFVDCDVVAMTDVERLFELADNRYAVMCVQHPPMEIGGTKMDGQKQTNYLRKLWSSVMLINCSHAGHLRLTLAMLNQYPGDLLHRFCWLRDNEIGALPSEWNWLVGLQDRPAAPMLAHYTLGTPNMFPDSQHPEIWYKAFSDMNGIE